MVKMLEIATILVVALTGVTSIAHALEFPGKMRLSREDYLAVQPIYYPGFTYAGAAEPLAIILVAVLLVLGPTGTIAFWLNAGALAAVTATHIIYWILTAPLNKFWLKDEDLSDRARSFFGSAGTSQNGEWTQLRDRWERSHLYRAVAASIGLILMTTKVVID